MNWVKYRGQELETGDLLFCRKDGLAFVDSGLSSGEPSRISSIPEAWSYDLDVKYEHPKAGLRKTGGMYNCYGDKADHIEYICKLKLPC